jgi:hypothetical protein
MPKKKKKGGYGAILAFRCNLLSRFKSDIDEEFSVNVFVWLPF